MSIFQRDNYTSEATQFIESLKAKILSSKKPSAMAALCCGTNK